MKKNDGDYEKDSGNDDYQDSGSVHGNSSDEDGYHHTSESVS